MRFSIPTSWQDEFVDFAVRNKQHISYVYGKLRSDLIGGGRSSILVPYISKKNALEHIRSLKENGIEFNYLFNATCMHNVEYSRAGRNRLKSLLDLLTFSGVSSVTVASPYLLAFVKKRYPEVKVCVSTFAGINSLVKAKHWEVLGADTLTLCLCAREFDLLQKIKASIHCKIQLIANQSCLYHCPFLFSHTTYVSHTSRRERRYGFLWLDYWMVNCLLYKLRNIAEIIKAPWIRPEDIPSYEALGIDSIKIAGRNLSNDRLCKIVQAYIQQNYDGNLLALFPDTLEYTSDKHVYRKGINRLLFFCGMLFNSSITDVITMNRIRLELKRLYKNMEIYIDNKSLHGFLEFFLKNNGCSQDCDRCGYCRKVADSVIRIEPASYQESLNRLEGFLENL